MKKHLVYLGGLAVLLITLAVARQASFSNNKAALKFPESVTFSADIQSDVAIKSIVLEYGSEQLTCGNVIAKAFPDFTPGKQASVSWPWDMRQSGSIPPGTKLWWQWVVTDTNGNATTSPRQEIIWLDDVHPWKTLGGEQINIHWYDGDQSFGKTLHTTAVDALKRLNTDVGAQVDKPVDLYIYGKTEDMRDAVLYEPGWTGGQAFPPFNVVIIGINQQNLDWGKSTEAHELTHVVTGHMTFNCLWSVPTWLDEGLAVYSEGKRDDASQAAFDKAVRDDTLMSLRSLSGGFSEKADKADLSYTESFSVVKFLIETYKRDKMSALLTALRDGDSTDEALQRIYGFDTDGLEDAWRASIGAKPRPVTGKATATPVPTFVPTVRPVSGIPGKDVTPVATPAVTSAAAAAPTSTLVATEASARRLTPTSTALALGVDPQAQATLTLIGTVCGLGTCILGILGVILILIIRGIRRQNDAQQ